MESWGDSKVVGGDLLISMARGCWGSAAGRNVKGERFRGPGGAVPGDPGIKACLHGMRGGSPRGAEEQFRGVPGALMEVLGDSPRGSPRDAAR